MACSSARARSWLVSSRRRRALSNPGLDLVGLGFGELTGHRLGVFAAGPGPVGAVQLGWLTTAAAAGIPAA